MLIQIGQDPIKLLFFSDSFCFDASLDFVLDPVSCVERYNKQNKIRKEADGWKGEFSIQLSKEYELDDLGEEEDQVEVADDINDKEWIINGLSILLNSAESSIKILNPPLNLNRISRCHEYRGELNRPLGGFTQDHGIFDHCLTVDAGEKEVCDSNNHHAFQSWVDRMLEDVEVAIVLGPSFNISLGVEPIGSLDIYLTGWLATHDLVGCAHFEEATTCVVVTIIDPLDDCFDFWGLDEVKDLKFDSDLEWISAREILLKNDGRQVVLIVDWLNILDDHDSDVLHELSAEEAKTKELLRQQVQELIK